MSTSCHILISRLFDFVHSSDATPNTLDWKALLYKLKRMTVTAINSVSRKSASCEFQVASVHNNFQENG